MLTGGYGDNTVRLWAVPTGVLIRTFTGLTQEVGGVTFLPDGHTVVASDYHGTLNIWNGDSTW